MRYHFHRRTWGTEKNVLYKSHIVICPKIKWNCNSNSFVGDCSNTTQARPREITGILLVAAVLIVLDETSVYDASPPL